MNRHYASCFIGAYVGCAGRQIVEECSVVFEWMLLSNDGGIWCGKDEAADEISSGHHEPEWGRKPHACELAHAPYARRLLEDQDALTHANSPFGRRCRPHTDIKARTSCSISCVTSVLPDYAAVMLLLVAVYSVPMGPSLRGFHPYVEKQKGRKLRGTEAREHRMRMSHPKEPSEVYL